MIIDDSKNQAMKERLKKHWAIIVFAFVVGFLTAQPTVRSISHIGIGDFKGIYPVFNADKLFYMSMAQDVYEGHLGLGNAYLQEHKGDPYIQPPLAEIILAGLAKVIGLNIPDLFFALDFIFPAAIIILLYLIFYCLTKSRIASFYFTAFHAAVFLPHYAMPINPQFSFIPFLAGIYFIIKLFIKSDQNKNRDILFNMLAGLMTVILVYIYPFFWTSLFVLYFMLTFVFFMTEGRNIKYLKNIIYYIAPFIVFILPYLANLFYATRNPYYAETISRYGLFNSHLPGSYYNIAMLATTMVALVVSRKMFDLKKHWYFAACLVISGVVLTWQNVITGKFLQFSTHYNRTAIIFAMMAFGLVAYYFLKEKKISVKKFVVIGLFLLFLFQAAHNHLAYTLEWLRISMPKQEMVDLQEYAVMFDWLNKNTPPDSTVYSINNQLINYLTVYTRNNTYFPSYGAVNLMSDDELENRWMSQVIFDKTIDRGYVGAVDIWVNKFIDQYQSQQTRKKIFGWLGINTKAASTIVPMEYSARLLQKYEKYKQGDPETLLKTYKLDYLVITDQDKNWQDEKKTVEGFNFFKLEKKSDYFLIYKML